MIDHVDLELSVAMQCEMVNIASSSYYASKKASSRDKTDEELKVLINEIYAKHPAYGSRRITENLKRRGIEINRKRTQRLMCELGIQGICPKRNTSRANQAHKKYPYIAREKPIVQINQVWSTDITYVPTDQGFVYLVAVIDWFSRFVLAWRMSNTMSEDFCIAALNEALQRGTPGIFNTDQGSQFTGDAFISTLLAHGIRPSMDGKGRATDNAQCERLWRTTKFEEIFFYEQMTYIELQLFMADFIRFYNYERPHQSNGYKTPSEVHFGLSKKTIDYNGRFVYTETELKYANMWK